MVIGTIVVTPELRGTENVPKVVPPSLSIPASTSSSALDAILYPTSKLMDVI
jgi:hypothetical protein